MAKNKVIKSGERKLPYERLVGYVGFINKKK